MRKLLMIIGAVAVVAAVLVLYLFATSGRSSAGVRFPLSATQRAMVARVPAAAEAFAFVPAAATLDAKLRSNPVTRDAVESWTAKQSLPRPWMIGSADLLAWRDVSGATRYLLNLDSVRASVVRTYTLLGGNIGPNILINTQPEVAIEPLDLDPILNLAQTLPPGDAFIVQRVQSRGAYPPIGRPAVTSVSVTPDSIDLTSQALPEPAFGVRPAPSNVFPRGAMLSATFASMPRVVQDLNRLIGAQVSPLLENGGKIAIYDVDTRKLLPRPLGVIAVPADDTRRGALQAFVDRAREGEALGVHVRTAERGGELLVSFDSSLDLYLQDQFDPPQWPAGRWAIRADPHRLVPVLRALGDNLGLRITARRVYLEARDLNRWIEALERAALIEADDSYEGPVEVLRVRITAK